jgi:hypothetical protein
MFDFYAKLTNIWNNLPVETGPIVEVEGTTFPYPKERPFIKGTLQGADGSLFAFMSFAIGMHTYQKDVLLNQQLSVLTFIQVTPDQWMFTISQRATKGTVAYPMMCCGHTIDMAEKLSKGEPAEHHLIDADGDQVLVQMKPLDLVLN